MSDLPAQESPVTSSGSGTARWLWLGSLLLCFVVLAQHFFGVGFTKTIDIEANSLRNDSGNAWKLKLPKEHRTYAALHHIKVFENGKELGPYERSNNRVRDYGSGRFRLDEKGTLRLSSSDNSSPAMNVRKYSIEVPARVKPLYLGASIALLLAASWLVWRRGELTMWRGLKLPSIGWAAVIFFIGVLGVRIWAMDAFKNYSDGGFSINGIPYSDAMGWLDQATALFRGNGFHGAYAGQRPFYSVFLAGAYHLFGESLHTGRMINVACGALSCLFLFLFIAHATGRRGIALAATIAFLFAHQQLTDLQLLITEPMGLTFIIAGAYAWWAGLLKVNPWVLFAAGALMGLSNVTRTFTMLGLPLFAFVTLGVCLLQRIGWKRTVLACAMFTMGATCVMAPWMIRQKIRYDTFALSTAGSDLLYSAAAESPGWRAELYDELKAAGIEREDLGAAQVYFSTRFSETVKQDPARYFKRLGSWMFEYITSHDYGTPLTRLAILIAGAIAALRGWRNGRVLAATGCFLASAALAPLVGLVPAIVVLTASAVIGLVLGGRMLRIGIVVLLTTLLSGAMMSAMIGNFGMNRMTPLTSWVFVAVLFLALEALASRLVDKASLPAEEDGDSRAHKAWAGVAGITAWAMIGVSAIAAGTVLASGFSNVGELRVDLELTEEAQNGVREWVREELPAAKNADDEVFFISAVRLDLYRGYINPRENTSHWARPFLPRDYGRTVAYVRVLPGDKAVGDLMAVQFRCPPEELEPGQMFVLAGVLNLDEDAPLGHDKEMVEGLALIPFSEDGMQRTLDFENAKPFPVTPEAAAILRSELSGEKPVAKAP